MSIRQLVLLFAFILPASAYAQLAGVDYDWKQKKDKDGIKIYTSTVEGSPFKAVRGEMVVEGRLASLVALVEDLDACPSWADLCKEARIEKRLSDSESFAYIYNDIPFPVKDRDVYTHVVWAVNSESGKVSMTSTATEGGTPKTKAVRIKNAVSQWHFTPVDNGKVMVENFAHIDPNGPTPAWVTNMMLVSSPFKSMNKMREMIEQGAYEDAEISFLK